MENNPHVDFATVLSKYSKKYPVVELEKVAFEKKV